MSIFSRRLTFVIGCSGLWLFFLVVFPLFAADTTPPTTPVVTDDGTYTTLTTQLHARWTSADPESSIVEYQYEILQNSLTGPVVSAWTSVGTATSAIATNLVTTSGKQHITGLVHGKTYYFVVKAKNGAGLWSDVGYSDGIVVDANVPTIQAITVTSGANFHNDSPLILQVQASDADGDSLLYQFSVNAIVVRSWQTTNQTTWQPQATDIGPQTVTVEVKDIFGATTQQSKTITLFRTPPRP